MDEESKQRYRRLRNGLGWALAAIWLLYRWYELSAQNAASKARIQGCDGFFGSVSCGVQKSGEDLGFGAGMLFALLLAPFAFLISHYIARFAVEKQLAEQARRDADVARAHRAREEEDQRQRIEDESARTREARDGIDRAEFVRSLGSVNDFLDLLSIAQNAEQELRVKQGIGKELRELVAKHTHDAITELVHRDDALRINLEETLSRIKKAGVPSNFTAVFRAALESNE